MRRAELARLRDGAAGQLGAGDPGREAEVVLDPPRRARLAAERRALDDERVQALRRAVDGRAEAGGAAADDQQVDLLARRKLEADPERARDLARRRAAQVGPAGEPHERQARRVELRDQRRGLRSSCAGSRQVNGSRLLRAKSSIRIVAAEECGPTISTPMPCDVLQRLAPRDERREQEVAERPVVEQERPQRVAVDGDVAQRLRGDRGQEDRLPGQEVQLAEEVGRSVPHDLVAGRVEDRDLALDDRDERIAPVADLKRTSPTFAVRSSPSSASVASCDGESEGLEGPAIQRGYLRRAGLPRQAAMLARARATRTAADSVSMS